MKFLSLSLLVLLSITLLSCNDDEDPLTEQVFLGFNSCMQTHSDLSKINGVRRIEGNLCIESQRIESLSALRRLESIDGDLIIRNTKIRNLDFLQHLRKVTDIHIENNEFLEKINFQNLDSIEDITIKSNPELLTVSGLGDAFVDAFYIGVIDNPKLTNLDDELNLYRSGIEGISIIGNHSLTSFNWLNNLKLSNEINITNNGLLESLSFLNNLQSCWYLEIKDNPSLTEIDLTHLSHLTLFSATDNAQLVTLSVNENSQSQLTIEGDFPWWYDVPSKTRNIWINNCPNLLLISGFNSVKAANAIEIHSNSSLNSIEGFESLKRSVIKIYNNAAIQKIEGFDSLQTVILTLQNNPSLRKIQLSKDIQKAERSELYLYDNSSLEHIHLAKFDSTSGIEIKRNKSIRHLDFLAELKDASCQFRPISIEDNSNLDDFCGLKQLLENQADSVALVIAGNKSNPTADMILEQICD